MFPAVSRSKTRPRRAGLRRAILVIAIAVRAVAAGAAESSTSLADAGCADRGFTAPQGALAAALDGVAHGLAPCDGAADFADAGAGACLLDEHRAELRVYDRACGPVTYRDRGRFSTEAALLRRTQLLFLFNREFAEISRLNPGLAEYAPRWNEFEARWKRILRDDPGATVDGSPKLSVDDRGALANRVASIPALREEKRKEYAAIAANSGGIEKPHLLVVLSASVMLQALETRDAKLDAGRIAQAENARRVAKRGDFLERLSAERGQDLRKDSAARSAAAKAFPELTFRDVLRDRRDAIYRDYPELLKDPSLRGRALAILAPGGLRAADVGRELFGAEGRALSEKQLLIPEVAAMANEGGIVAANQEVQMAQIHAKIGEALAGAAEAGSRAPEVRLPGLLPGVEASPVRAPSSPSTEAERAAGIAGVIGKLGELDGAFQKASRAIRDGRQSELEEQRRDSPGLFRHANLVMMASAGLDPVAGRREKQALIARYCTTSWADADLDRLKRGALVAGGAAAALTGVGALGLTAGSVGLGVFGGAGMASTASALGAGAAYLGIGALVTGGAMSAAEVAQAYDRASEAENRFYASLARFNDVEAARSELRKASAMAGLTVGSVAAPALRGVVTARAAASAGAASASASASTTGTHAASRAITYATVAGEIGVNGTFAYLNVREHNYTGLGMMGLGLGLAYGKQGAQAYRWFTAATPR